MRRLEDDFEVLKTLGAGSFGKVLLVRDRKTGQEWAAKVLTASDADAAHRFRREVLQLHKYQGLRHVMKVVRGVLDATPPYFIMPLAKGGTLQQHIGKLTTSQQLSVMRQLMETLAHIHAAGGLHRDVKPPNILLSEGACTLADFGLGNAVGCTITFTQNAMGTPGYAAPELYRPGGQCSAASDVFSAGATWFHVMTGVVPRNLPLPLNPRAINPQLEKNAAEWIQLMTDANPLRRPTAWQVLHAIKAGLPAGDIPLPTEQPASAAPWFAAAASLVLLFGAIALLRNK